MNLFESDACRVDFDVWPYEQAAENALVVLTVRHGGGPTVGRSIFRHASVLPPWILLFCLHLIVDLGGHVPEVRLHTTHVVVVVAEAAWSGRGWPAGGVRWNLNVQQRLTANYAQVVQRKVFDVIADDQHVTVHLYYINRSITEVTLYRNRTWPNSTHVLRWFVGLTCTHSQW